MMKEEQDNRPWYRQFWLWVVLAPLIAVVCAMSVMVTMAFRNADDVVIDNYYKQGRMINQTMEQDRRALALNLSAHLRFDRTTGEVFMQIPGQEKLPEQLLLLLGHPFDADLDQQLIMQKLSANNYRGELTSNPSYAWYLTLMPELDPANRKDAEWILSGEIDFETAEETDLRPRVGAQETR